MITFSLCSCKKYEISTVTNDNNTFQESSINNEVEQYIDDNPLNISLYLENSLKFYNGPSFTNEYSKPKFSATGSNLTGISFSTQTISFQVGAYWLTEAEYREFIN